ncbi:MAG: hypothetical protein KAG19_07890 [Methylococcales bacterium]|nr:hypothetical protein [Methylococcales bacterium]
MASEISSYTPVIHGGPNGFQSNRAQIELRNNGILVGMIRFHDPGMAFDNDSDNGTIILMHLPTTMFEGTLDILRNERPMHIFFVNGSGFLSTTQEPVGEAE